MAEGRYHKSVKDAICKVAKENERHKAVFKEKTIPLPHPTRSFPPLLYLPEVYIVTKQGKKYIFEILDSQGKDSNLIIADIIQSYLVENVRKVFFIAKNKTEYDRAYRLSNIIGARLEENGYKKKDLPDVTVYLIEKSNSNPKKLYRILKKYARKDGWGV